jgi:uncharacterized membrane protein
VEAIGPVLILFSIPLMLRWIPPNRVYGFRVPATLRNRSVWYDANAVAAHHFCLLGLGMSVLEFVLPLSLRTPVLRVTGLVGLILVIALDWRTANRWEQERTRTAQ